MGLGIPLGCVGGGALVDEGDDGLLGFEGFGFDGLGWWLLGEDGLGFEWPVPGCRGGGVGLGEGLGAGFFGGGELVCVGGGVVWVGGGVLGQDSWMLTTPTGSLSVEGGTPGGRWK